MNHLLVLIAAIPAVLVLAIRFFSKEDRMATMLFDIGLIVVSGSILWTAGFGTKTLYGLASYTILLGVALISLIIRWKRMRKSMVKPND